MLIQTVSASAVSFSTASCKPFLSSNSSANLDTRRKSRLAVLRCIPACAAHFTALVPPPNPSPFSFAYSCCRLSKSDRSCSHACNPSRIEVTILHLRGAFAARGRDFKNVLDPPLKVRTFRGVACGTNPWRTLAASTRCGHRLMTNTVNDRKTNRCNMEAALALAELGKACSAAFAGGQLKQLGLCGAKGREGRIDRELVIWAITEGKLK